ncbi:hypothetical protein COEREDRAFT_79388 [Coemansia reversa NRRL 1564]|uniref:CAP-Gly domain-containing protein n=1 Tax=Coemansia reversa (strain ATCC 12441 / NRRL 1564) TaxID=763665 RepID=A0A2G5BJ98_COERN|nr:hypothetical protein COEREDRAFT_79388 [Coemansia reversa NRRL 1564]|eukprot:PIA18827.1 hypothetical protein COEREDRAFT_79388 [Coemansia reversa NRRL 1564]
MSVVILFVESQNARSERRFQKSLTVEDLRSRLEPIVGIPSGDQRIELLKDSTVICEISSENKMLGSYPVEDYMILRITNNNPTSAMQLNFNDSSQVEKFVMEDEEYDKLNSTVRAFKRRHNLGRFSDAKSAISIDEDDEFKNEAEFVKVGNRCEVSIPGYDISRRGTVRFVGKTSFRAGYWIGVEYDEPVGRNDGSVAGHTYFKCPSNHGSFVRPDKVKVGDYPEEDLFASDLEEM